MRIRGTLIAGSLILGACSSNQDCELGSPYTSGCPLEVKQALVTNAEPDDPKSGLKLVYGVHDAVNVCDTSETCPSGTTCKRIDGNPRARHCVDAAGRQPGARAVPVSGLEIRIVFNLLLDGRSVEQFACDCDATGGICAAGHEYSVDPYHPLDAKDPFACPSCESHTCLARNDYGIPDVTVLQPGLATITCGTFVYVTGLFDGEYDASGNSLLGYTTGLDNLGPAIVLRPTATLPADSDCTVTLSQTIRRDRTGERLTEPDPPLSFHTH